MNKTVTLLLVCSLVTILASISLFTLLENKKQQPKNAIITEHSSTMKQQIITSLTFQKNDAEQAMNLYVSLFDNSKIRSEERGVGKEGKSRWTMEETKQKRR